MATRSRIAVINEDKSVSSIYCHWDGDLNYVGAILKEYYPTKDRADALIALGSLSTLGPKLSLDDPYRADEECPVPEAYRVTKAYYRDRAAHGDDLTIAKHRNMRAYRKAADEFWEEFNYVFYKGQWYLLEQGKKLRKY